MPLQQIVHTSTPPPITSYRDAIVPGSPHEDVRAFLDTDPIKIAGVAIFSLRRQMVADAGCFADRQEGDGHEERGDVVGPQQPLVHMRQVVQEGQQGRQQRHGLRFSVQSLKENLIGDGNESPSYHTVRYL